MKIKSYILIAVIIFLIIGLFIYYTHRSVDQELTNENLELKKNIQMRYVLNQSSDINNQTRESN